MNTFLKIKTGILLVLTVLWILAAFQVFTMLSEAHQLSKKTTRLVEMVDAWSYSSGNSREGYEGRFIDDSTKLKFTHRIEAYEYHAFAKNPVPVKSIRALSEIDITEVSLGALAFGCGLLFVALALTLVAFGSFQATLFERNAGMVWEWYSYLRSKL